MSIPTVLVLPCPAQGHVNPFINLSQKLIEQGCHVTFVNTEFNHKRVVNAMVEQQDLDNYLNESKIKLVSIPDGLKPEDDRTDIGELGISVRRTMPEMLEKLIREINLKGDYRISCIVVDAWMGWGLKVACELGIRGAVFWTISAATSALMLNTPRLIHDGIIDSQGFPKTKKTFQISPSMTVMETRALFWAQMDDPITEKKIFNYMVHCTQTLNLTEWWLCNTAYELEVGPLSFIPKLLPIGPLLRNYDHKNASLGQFWKEDITCMSWLDQQPHRSVLYVAFGSFTIFDTNQFRELALGLELTNRPFLWVVRQDSSCNNKMEYPNEFKGSQGKIVGWVPQLKVLSHPAIACFVSHCGRNSVLEGLSNGVPFLCWPYFLDQFYEKTNICDELKVGLGLDLDENGLVSRGEIKTKVDKLFSDENLRSRAIEIKKKIMNNIGEGGRSSENFSKFIKWLKE